NSSLWMVIVVAAVTAFMLLGTRKQAIVPGRWQSLCEGMYDFVSNMLKDNVGKEGRRFFPFVFTLFMFVLFANVLGLLPGAFTVTSHIIVTFGMAAFIFLMVTVVGLVRHGFRFFSYFAPEGAPMWLMPVMIPIEILSYLIRPMTLSIRLFANMVAGHVMLAVIGGFAFALGVWAGWLPVAVVSVLFGLELLIACLQAYVFTILTCIYLHDAIHLH
ncbi:MAG TPA: F0F1 ATP synthase subunit A, partial [Dongiaceae bacterium]|nr:F0F1 ATP synthase subunit A [Dongiaceae bacterium]